MWYVGKEVDRGCLTTRGGDGKEKTGWEPVPGRERGWRDWSKPVLVG